jgi:hypothetical protein
MRRASSAMVQDALAKKGGSGPQGHIQTGAATEWAGRKTGIFMGAVNHVLIGAWKAHKKASGIPWYRTMSGQDEFFETVGRVLKGEQGIDNKLALDSAEQIRQVIGELAMLAKRHNVRGFEWVEPGENWMPRFFSDARLDQAISTYGPDEVARLFEESLILGLRKKGEDLDRGTAKKWGKAMLTILQNKQAFNDLERAQIFSGQRLDLLERLLREEGVELAEEQIQSITDVIKGTLRKPGQANIITPRGRRRAPLDENTKIVLNKLPEAGGGTGEQNINDLVNNNIHQVMEIYTRQITGAAAMTEVFRELGRVWGKSIRTFDDLTRVIRDDYTRAKKEGVKITEDVDDQIKTLDVMHKSITGQRIHPDTKMFQHMRNLRLFAHVAGSGQFGIAQLPELGLAIGGAGMTAMVKSVPVFLDIISSMFRGDIDNALLRELRVFVGLGLSRKNNSLISRFDDSEMIREAGGGRMERFLRLGAKFANDLSFMAPFHVFQQQSLGAMASQRLADMAVSGRKLSKSRLDDFGLTAAQGERVMQGIRDNVSWVNDIEGGRIREFNMGQWKDAQASSDLIQALQRWSSFAVQENDIGNVARWMTHPAGQLLMQFRGFPFVAMRKQMMRRGLQMADRQQQFTTLMEVFWSLMIGGTAYTVQQYTLSLGRPDRDEFLAKNLGETQGERMRIIGAAAIQRAGTFSFTPDVFDSLWHLAGGETSVFNYRNSGLPTLSTFEGWLSNPSFNLGNKGYSTIKAITTAAWRDDQSWSSEDMRRSAILMPFGRAMGVTHGINLLSGLFPEE